MIPLPRRRIEDLGMAGLIVVVLLVAIAIDNPASGFVRSTMPVFDFCLLSQGLFFGTVLAAALRLATLKAMLPRMAALTATSYALSAIAVAFCGSWLDFVGRTGRYRGFDFVLPGFWTTFFDAHDVLKPFEIGLWALLTPGAVLTGLLLAIAFRLRWLHGDRLATQLPRLLLGLAVPCVVFNFGSLMAEDRLPAGEVCASQLTIHLGLVALLGSFVGWLAMPKPSKPPNVSLRGNADLNLDKVASSASQLSVVSLILLALGLSQCVAYGDALQELVDARTALASDLVAAFGKNVSSGTSVYLTNVQWAIASIVEYKGPSQGYRVDVHENVSGERWSFPGFAGSAQTEQMADRVGVKYERNEAPERIYPRIDAQLRAKNVAFPSTGLSVGMKSFVLLIPLVIGAVLVVLGGRLERLNGFRFKDPWLLLEAGTGLSRTISWLWLACIAFGPLVLGVLFVEVLSLTNKTRGLEQSTLADFLSTGFAAFSLVLLLIASKSCVASLLTLRSQVSPDATNEGAAEKVSA